MALVSKPFGDIVTFTRGSGGGITNAQGNYEWLGNDVPRFDYDPVTKAVKGLLIEEQRTNLLTYSEQFDNSAWTKASGVISANAAVAPDGVQSADKYVFGSGVITNNAQLFNQQTVSASTAYTLSVFAKAAELSVFRASFICRDAGNAYLGEVGYEFNLADSSSAVVTVTPAMTASHSATITPVGDGWFRCAITTTTTSTTGRLNGSFRNAITGDGTSGIYIWGAQLEQGSFPTSYIPTKATFTARNSIGTYHDSTGVLRTAAADVARYDHGYVDGQWVSKGLLLEGQSTNLLTYSEDFGATVAWGRIGARTQGYSGVSPDKFYAATKLLENVSTTAEEHFVEQWANVVAGNSYVFTCFAKAGERSQLGLRFTHAAAWGGASHQAVFDLVAGTAATVTGSPTAWITPCGGGWYKVSIATIATTSMAVTARLHLMKAGTNYYTGDGTSGIYIWGAQLEVGDRPTSYIPTPAVFTSRASTKTYFDSTGVMRTAAVDEAAIDHAYIDGQWVSKGLSVEGQATNLLLQSEAFDAAAWGKSNTTVAANVVIAPDGTSSGDKLVETATSLQHNLSQGVTGAGSRVLSVYAKSSGDARHLRMLAYNTTDAERGKTYFNLTTGTVISGPGSIVSVGNGWYRCSVSATSTVNDTLFISLSKSGADYDYTGDGTSGIYIWGAQLELGNTPTSYIPTTAQVTRAADVTSSAQVTRVADSSTSSQVTRAADLASVNDLSGWYRQDEGTLVVEGEVTSRTPTRISADIGAGGAFGTTLYLAHSASVTNAAPGAAPINAHASVPDTALTFKSALAMRKNGMTVASNGVLGLTDTSCEMPMAPNKLSIGKGGWSSSTNYLNGHIKSIKYLPRRVSDDELKALTV